MNFNLENDIFPSSPVCSPLQLALTHDNPTTKWDQPETVLKSTPSKVKFQPRTILNDAHTHVCQKSQYGYDTGLHWRILAAILYGIYTWFPLNTTSRIVGKLARVPLPKVLRVPVMRLYAWIFSARLEEAEFHNDLARYISISHFFRRRLVPSARPIDSVSSLTCPADGKVISCGRVEEGHLEQVKGLAYTLRGLLGPHASLQRRCVRRTTTLPSRLDTLKRENTTWNSQGPSKASFVEKDGSNDTANNLHHCAIYLAPGDYHCFHSPANWQFKARRHFPGRLFSVCNFVTSWLNGVFCINERAVYLGEWVYGFFAFVAVGATNVGSIHVFSDPGLVTNRQPNYFRQLFTTHRGVKVTTNDDDNTTDSISTDERGSVPVIMKMDGYEDLHFQQPLFINKGELFGEFNFGSTIVLIFEAPEDFKFFVKPTERVLVGQALGHVVKSD